MTDVALLLLRLMFQMKMQRKGRGVTLSQLTELYRGTKNKQYTKFLDTGKIMGYGDGSKYRRADIDRITRAMIFEGIFQEVPETNGSGFNSDFLHG